MPNCFDSTSILVTGASGFVGQAVCYQAALKGFTVCASVRNLQAAPVNVHSVVRAELTSETDWTHMLCGVEVLVHCAARVHVMHETAFDVLSAFRKVNVDATLNLARQAAAAGIKRFIFISSVKVNGEFTEPEHPFTEDDAADPQDAYGKSKLEAELGLRLIAADTGMEVVIIRPPLVYGPGVKANFAVLVRTVKHGLPLPLGAVQNQRSLVALDNLVDFIILCIYHPDAANQTFLVSDGHDISTTELVRCIAKVAMVPARLLPVPRWALLAIGSFFGKYETVQRLCGNLQVDISKARSLLGWVPRVTLDEGLKRSIAL
jgi:nucleoside-diphosphate-sugar epimerase